MRRQSKDVSLFSFCAFFAEKFSVEFASLPHPQILSPPILTLTLDQTARVRVLDFLKTIFKMNPRLYFGTVNVSQNPFASHQRTLSNKFWVFQVFTVRCVQG